MISFEYIPITIEDRDIKKTFEFNGTQYKIRLRKNDEFNFYVIEVFSIEDVFLFSSRIGYRRMFLDSKKPGISVDFMPLDIQELINNVASIDEITDDNLGVQVQLYTSISET